MNQTLRRFLTLLGLAALAHWFAFQFIFPGEFRPFSAHHSDMYLPASTAAGHFDLHSALSYPRPVLMLLATAGGSFGFEGSLLFFTLFNLINFALAIWLLETLLLKTTVRWPVVIATALFTFSFPGYYIAYTHDVGMTFAILFGLLGLQALDSAAAGRGGWGRAALLLALCTLSKESFFPALMVLVTALILRRGQWDRTALGLLGLPLVALGVMLIDSRLTKSIFVNIQANAEDPYHVVLAPASLLKLLGYYLSPLFNLWVILLLAACALGSWLHGRLLLFGVILLASLSLYAPYTLLPNHRMPLYWWSAACLLPLLLPVALAPKARRPADHPGASGPSPARWPSGLSATSIWAFAVMTLLSFQTFGHTHEDWNLLQQKINRNLLAGLRAIRADFAPANSVLICGLSFPFSPWAFPEFLNQELGFNGTWQVVRHEGVPDSLVAASVRSVPDHEIRWEDYDLIIAFDDSGALTAVHRPAELLALASQLGLQPAELAAALRDPILIRHLTAYRRGDSTPGSIRDLGERFLNLGQCATAIVFLQTATEQDPSDRYAHYFLGKALAALHRNAEALLQLKSAVALDASAPQQNPYFKSSLTQLEEAMAKP